METFLEIPLMLCCKASLHSTRQSTWQLQEIVDRFGARQYPAAQSIFLSSFLHVLGLLVPHRLLHIMLHLVCTGSGDKRGSKPQSLEKVICTLRVPNKRRIGNGDRKDRRTTPGTPSHYDGTFRAYTDPRAAIPSLALPELSTRRLSAQLDPSAPLPIQAGSQ